MVVALCGNEMQCREQVINCIIKSGNTLGIEIRYDIYKNGTELLENDIRHYKIIFFDMDIKDEKVCVAEWIRKLNPKVEIVFLTSFVQNVVNNYQVNVYRFLEKPIEYGDFLFQLKEMLLKYSNLEKKNLILQKDGQDYFVNPEDIIYIEMIRYHLIYHCVNCDITTDGSLKKVENSLKGYYFVRIHNSCIINVQYITEMRTQSLILKNGKKLSIAKNRKRDVNNVYLEFWRDKLS